MIGAFQRRQLFVHPVQYWFLITTLIYFACLLILLYAVVFVPIALPLSDPAISWEQQAQIATQFLDLNARVWPWLIVTFLVLLLHSMYFMHRIAGPLYRFSTLFQSIGTGRLNQRARLRKHDYLHQEAQAFNRMLDHLENRIQAVAFHSTRVTQAYQAVALQIRAQAPGQISHKLLALEREIQRLKASVTEFELPTEHSTDQRDLDFTESSTTDSPTAIKAA